MRYIFEFCNFAGTCVSPNDNPFFVINLVLPNDQADVNVHPMKLEVRFKDEWRLFNVLKHVVSDALGSILQTAPGFNTCLLYTSPSPRD